MLPRMQCDKGAIKFVLNGSNIMCPGLTSPGGSMPVPVVANQIVVSLSCTLFPIIPVLSIPTLSLSLASDCFFFPLELLNEFAFRA